MQLLTSKGEIAGFRPGPEGGSGQFNPLRWLRPKATISIEMDPRFEGCKPVLFNEIASKLRKTVPSA